MKFLKHTLIILLLLTLCLGAFAACFGSEESTDAPTETPTGDTPTENPDDDNPAEDYQTITIAQALELCGESGNITEDRYYIRATVKTISNAEYGSMVIMDDTGEIEVYGTYSADGAKKFNELEETPHKGDEVLLYCILQNYNGTKEVKNAWLIEFKEVETTVDETKYADMTIADARATAEGTLVKVDGVVAQITYANGKIPSGVYLVDDTNSIYVYDRDLAQRVEIGNTVTILASKTYWVLEDEQNNAQKHGYNGCCQLEEVVVKSVDETVVDYNKTWITESTVKEILDTPVSENITTTIYKVNALVSKQEGKGFTNYYFYDLDGETGSYTYTQCNGSDFTWIDKFDGKICTVYLSVINAKSTSSDCVYRLLPVEIIDEGFVFDTNNAAEHAVKYYGVTQFISTYTGNPALEMTTSVTSEHLGFEGATLAYASSNTEVVSFTEENGKLIFNCLESGSADVTITGTYNGKTYSETIKITVASNEAYDTITVEEAIASAVDTEVTIKGIVGPSLVNQTGFYLIDESGIIAIRLSNASDFDTIAIGNEIVIKGTRSNTDKGAQICVNGAAVLANYYGAHEYCTDTFITDKTFADVVSISGLSHTAEVYVVSATLSAVGDAYYQNYVLTDGTNSITLYASSAKQYGFLSDYVDTEITVELALCDWNAKGTKGCVLAVYTEDGKILNELNFG